MIDSHVHLDDSKYSDEDRAEIADGFEKENIRLVVNNACDFQTMFSGLELAEKFEKVFFTVGCHPHDAKSFDEKFERELVRLARHPKAVAVGEIGLDYHYDLSERDVQKEVFARQLRLARELELPVVIHTREAWKDTLDVLEAQGDFPQGILFHCFSGSTEIVKLLSKKYDAFFSFGGAITFSNFGGADVVKAVPQDRLIVETDCPYMTPVPYRGKTNRPAFVRLVVAKLAKIRGMTFEQAEQITEKNTFEFFKKLPH